ncbi:MAG: response regulator [Polyangiaceae bacterium]|nr:response regulator [Polyangiaceae bacterium]
MSGRIVGGKYRLEREIGRGGMGSIWVAFDTTLRRRVALKLMGSEQPGSPVAQSRFEREAMAIAQLRNPHVIQIHDYGIDEGGPYIVMELLEGEDLEVRLERQRTLPLAAASMIVAQAAKALTAAHAVGIVHRDLKPANIFLVASGSEEVVKLLDFGVATMLAGFPEASLLSTRVGSLVGTPAYMSPEQARGRAVDHRTDLWSLAVVAYRALTGRLPFDSDRVGELIVDICTAAPPPPSSTLPDLGPAVDRFFEQALSKDPEGRFQSARQMAAAFAAVVEAAGPPRAAKILVVDDEPDVSVLIRQRFRQQIRRSVYEFSFASDGAAALDQLRQNPDIEVVLTDINMPGMDGLTFLEHAGEVNPMIRVVMVSAYSDMANIRTAMNRGAVDFLVKPLDMKDLELTLAKEIKRAREVRRSIQSTDDQHLLRLFMNDGIVDRLLPIVRGPEEAATAAVPGTVALIGVFDFLAIAGARSPDAAVRLLNACFDVIVPEITSRQGVVDKFLGDAVMAVFQGKGHAPRAVEAALSARAELARRAEADGPDSPYASGVAAGIASGELISGSVGAKALGRRGATVLGPVVDAASRLSRMGARGQILVDAALRGVIGQSIACRETGQTLLRHAEPTPVYEVIERSPAAQVETPTIVMEQKPGT